MPDRMSRFLPRDVYTHLRREGLRATLKAGLRRMNASYEGYYYYANYRYKRFRERECVDEDDVFRTITIDPDSIVYLPTQRFDKWANMGEIRGGNWDQPDGKFENKALFQALQARFEEDEQWEVLEYVQQALETVSSGGSTWNGCRSRQDVHDRCEQLDRLYDSIRTNGLQPQATLYDTDPKSLLLSGSFDRSRTDIAVHVARNGEFRFVDGNHRLSIAKILDLDEIPVRVVIRHQQWQAFRETVDRTSDLTRVDDQMERARDHPDVEQVK